MSQQAQAMLQAQQKTTEPTPAKGSILQRAAVVPAITPVHSRILQRCSGGVECEECRQKRLEREGMLQRAAVNAAPVNSVPPIVHDVLSSSGQPLDAGTKTFMEPRFGYDFSQVRVHTDARAAESARAVNALAYTVGRDVVFGNGEYEPGTSEGRRLLAHELTHVVQQQAIGTISSIQRKLEVGQPDDAYEQEAEAQAANVMEGNGIDTVQVKGQLGIARLQRKIDPAELLKGTGCDVPNTSPPGPMYATVQFDFDSDKVSAKEKAEISKFVAGPGGDSSLVNVRVDGYASPEGNEEYNLGLSCRRAKAVRKELANDLNISEASIATFAHGRTKEFSKKLPGNRVVIISATSVRSPKPVPGCPGGVKTVTVDMVSLRGSNRNPPADLDFANNVFRPCCVQFAPGIGITASQKLSDAWLGGDTDIQKGNACGTASAEEIDTFSGATREFNLSSRIRAFYVSSASSRDRGYSYPPFCATGPAAAVRNMAVVTNDAASRSLAHELGHILLNSRDHPADTKNLMHPTNTATGEQLEPAQCATIAANA
jgi:outer membrane protein OmpA-like peptidoglycan-associated protein